MTNEEIRGKIYKECPVNTWQTVDRIQNLTRLDVLEERICTYVLKRNQYAGLDDSMAFAYDTVVNDLLNMQMEIKENNE